MGLICESPFKVEVTSDFFFFSKKPEKQGEVFCLTVKTLLEAGYLRLNFKARLINTEK